jgi:hypothetical protein
MPAISRRSALAFLYAVPISLLGGLMGLGAPSFACRCWRVRWAIRHARRQDLVETVAPMGLGSVLGAVVGGMLVGLVPAAALKVILGIILIVSAIRIFHGQHAAHKSGAH